MPGPTVGKIKLEKDQLKRILESLNFWIWKERTKRSNELIKLLRTR
jgi:hypothetical protein